jgi:hypothetical protein
LRRWRRITAYASGALAWRDGMLLEDYYDAVSFNEAGRVPRERWVDDLRAAAAAASLDGLI